MVKNKSKIIAFILIAILLFFVPISFAAEETDAAPISESATPEQETQDNTNDESQNANTSEAENTMKKSDVYLTGDNITIDYLVDGNAFIIANNVTIDSQIGGDVFICADKITIGEQGAIYSNLFAMANSIDIKGIVYDVYTISQDFTVSGYIYRDLKIISENVNLFGRVARNAFISCNTMNFLQNTTSTEDENTTISSQGLINGNLEYSSPSEITIPENTVMGETKYTQLQNTNGNSIQMYLISLGTFLFTTLIIWLFCLWLAPKFLDKTSNLATKKILPILGFGILGIIIIPIISVLLLTLSISMTIGLVLLVLYFILLGLSSSIFAIGVSNCIAKKLKVDKTIGILGILILSAIVLWALQLIPYVGPILSLVYCIIGAGIVLTPFILKKKENNAEENN